MSFSSFKVFIWGSSRNVVNIVSWQIHTYDTKETNLVCSWTYFLFISFMTPGLNISCKLCGRCKLLSDSQRTCKFSCKLVSRWKTCHTLSYCDVGVHAANANPLQSVNLCYAHCLFLFSTEYHLCKQRLIVTINSSSLLPISSVEKAELLHNVGHWGPLWRSSSLSTGYVMNMLSQVRNLHSC